MTPHADTPTDATLEALEALFEGFGNVYELLRCPAMHIEAGTLTELLAELDRLEQLADEDA
jgi:hypothetical protein